MAKKYIIPFQHHVFLHSKIPFPLPPGGTPSATTMVKATAMVYARHSIVRLYSLTVIDALEHQLSCVCVNSLSSCYLRMGFALGWIVYCQGMSCIEKTGKQSYMNHIHLGQHVGTLW